MRSGPAGVLWLCRAGCEAGIRRRLAGWLPHLDIRKAGRAPRRGADIEVLTVGALAKRPDFAQHKFDLVIVDESIHIGKGKTHHDAVRTVSAHAARSVGFLDVLWTEHPLQLFHFLKRSAFTDCREASVSTMSSWIGRHNASSTSRYVVSTGQCLGPTSPGESKWAPR
jgi:hypothetical protein